MNRPDPRPSSTLEMDTATAEMYWFSDDPLLILKSIAWAGLPGFRWLIDPTWDTLTAELVPVEAEPVPLPVVVQ